MTRSRIEPDAPLVIVVCGPPCSGKTTLGKALSGLTGALLFNQEQFTGNEPSAATKARDVRLPAYQQMHRQAGEAHGRGESLVLDGTYSRHCYREDLRSQLGSARLMVVEVRVNADVAIQRFVHRVDSAADQTVEMIRSRHSQYPWSNNVTRIDLDVVTAQEAAQTLCSSLQPTPKADLEGWLAAGLRFSALP